MTAYEMGKYWMTDALESYREKKPGDGKRAYIDRLMDRSRKAAGNCAEEKRLHNLIVLRYMAESRPPKQRICRLLHAGRQSYEAVTAQAIDRLLVLAFGISGVDWGDRRSGTP